MGDTTITDLHAILTEMDARERLEVLDLLPATIKAATDTTVAELRNNKVTWAEIGTILGVSPQAAQQRFKDAVGDD